MGVSVSDLLQRGDYTPEKVDDEFKRRDSFKRRISWLGLDVMDGKTVLDLSMKELRATPTYVYRRATSVQILKLNGNYIQSLPYDLLGLTELEELYLHSNHIRFLPAQVCALTNLRVLNISCNSLRTLPYGVCHLGNLEDLDVSYNEICTLPESMMYLLQMTSLNVEGNQLDLFPAVLTKISSLKTLAIGRNDITTIPDDISKLSRLQQFKANDNRLYSLTEHVCLFLSTVQTIDLTGNLRELKITPPPSAQNRQRRRSLNIIPFTRRLSKRFRRKSTKDLSDVEELNTSKQPKEQAMPFSAVLRNMEQCEDDSVYVFQSFAFGEQRRSNRHHDRLDTPSAPRASALHDGNIETVSSPGIRSPTRVSVRGRKLRQFATHASS